MNAPAIINVHEAKTHFSKLLDRAHAGEELLLAKAGVPYARLMPLAAPSGQRKPGKLMQLGAIDDAWLEPLPASELISWMQA